MKLLLQEIDGIVINRIFYSIEQMNNYIFGFIDGIESMMDKTEVDFDAE